MSQENIIASLSQILSDILGEEVALHADSTAQDIEGWDSLVQMTFLLVAEKTFGLELSIQEVSHFENVGALARLIEERKGSTHA